MATVRTKSSIYEEIIQLVQECSQLEGLEVEKVKVLSEEVALLKAKLLDFESVKNHNQELVNRNKELVESVTSTFDNIDRLRDLVGR